MLLSASLQNLLTLDLGTLISKMVLHQYDYLFAIGTIFAFLDAFNIGICTYAVP